MEELWSLTSFFGYSTQTFVQAVNLFDRFLAIMKVGLLTVRFFVEAVIAMFASNSWTKHETDRN